MEKDFRSWFDKSGPFWKFIKLAFNFASKLRMDTWI